MSSARKLVFGVLTLAGVALFLYSWSQPWWLAYIVALKAEGVTIFPYAMRIGAALQDYPQWLVGATMPAWFFPSMWVYLGLCVAALVFSLFVSDDLVALGKFRFSLQKGLVGIVGLSYVVFVVVFVVVVSMRAPQFYNAPLQGSVFVHMAEHEGNAESYVDTGLQFGFWLACTVSTIPTSFVFASQQDCW